jgi:hypothetical protein
MWNVKEESYLSSTELEVEGLASGPRLVEDLPVLVSQSAHVVNALSK